MKKVLLVIILILILIGCEQKENEPTKDNDTITQNEETLYLGSDNDVYRINITTNNNEFPSSLTTYINGSLNITEQDTEKVLLKNKGMRIRLRGNSTSDPDKKPFKIKFDKAQSLFGLEAAKDWVLLANYYDKTNIRNYLAYQLANKLDNLQYQPSCIFVDVYVNDVYQGLYTLSEQVEANKGRVDIEDNFSDDKYSSFLIETDWRALSEYAGYENKCYIQLEGYALKFKYPSCNDYLEALNINDKVYIEYYEKNIKWAFDFLYSSTMGLKTNDYDIFSKNFNIDSFIDYYLLQEFFKNVDAGGLSQFYYIKQEANNTKISCGPVWDFDISGGVVDDSQGEYSYYHNTKLFVREADSFYRLLFKNETFISKVKDRYKEVRPLFLEVFDEIIEIENVLAKAQNRNLEKWPFPTERRDWIEIYAIANSYYSLQSLEEHYLYLSDFLTSRLALLDQTYL